MVGRASEHAAGQLRPGLERLAPLYQFGVRSGQLPHPADTVARLRRGEGHALEVLWLGLIFEQARGRRDRVPKGRVRDMVVDALAIDKNSAAVSQALDVLSAVLDHERSSLFSYVVSGFRAGP